MTAGAQPAGAAAQGGAGGEAVLAFPEVLPPRLDKALGAAGLTAVRVGGAEAADRQAPPEGWAGAVVSAGERFEEAIALCRALRSGDEPLTPLLLVAGASQLAGLDLHGNLFDDFLLAEAPDEEVEARLQRWFTRPAGGSGHEIISYGPLALNLETYQAVVAGRPLDLTFMEYELLRFLAAHPGKVFTRETLLSRVWGYEYFGGARTVDVHVRRLRAKLGEEHANLIETVRSVGYRFGRARWTP